MLMKGLLTYVRKLFEGGVSCISNAMLPKKYVKLNLKLFLRL